jgi:outer membrane protein assembly factor BamD
VFTFNSGSHNDFSWFTVTVTTVVIAVVIFFLVGCKKKTKQELDYKTQAEKTFNQAMKDVYNGSCGSAFKKFEKVSEIYPYSELSKKSSIMQIYCEFLQKNYESAASLADLHEKFYPYDENGDYANYIKSLSLFKLMRGYKRDIAAIEDAELAINILKENYPSSKYNNILESKMLEIQKLKYLNELEIATFYFKTHKFLSALKQVILLNNQYKSYSFYNSTLIKKLNNEIQSKIILEPKIELKDLESIDT